MKTKLSGEEIRAARLRLGLTQYELAQRLGCRPETVARWETGKGLPNRWLQEKLIRVLKLGKEGRNAGT